MRFLSNGLRTLGVTALIGASATSQAHGWPWRPVRARIISECKITLE